MTTPTSKSLPACQPYKNPFLFENVNEKSIIISSSDTTNSEIHGVVNAIFEEHFQPLKTSYKNLKLDLKNGLKVGEKLITLQKNIEQASAAFFRETSDYLENDEFVEAFKRISTKTIALIKKLKTTDITSRKSLEFPPITYTNSNSLNPDSSFSSRPFEGNDHFSKGYDSCNTTAPTSTYPSCFSENQDTDFLDFGKNLASLSHKYVELKKENTPSATDIDNLGQTINDFINNIANNQTIEEKKKHDILASFISLFFEVDDFKEKINSNLKECSGGEIAVKSKGKHLNNSNIEISKNHLIKINPNKIPLLRALDDYNEIRTKCIDKTISDTKALNDLEQLVDILKDQYLDDSEIDAEEKNEIINSLFKLLKDISDLKEEILCVREVFLIEFSELMMTYDDLVLRDKKGGIVFKELISLQTSAEEAKQRFYASAPIYAKDPELITKQEELNKKVKNGLKSPKNREGKTFFNNLPLQPQEKYTEMIESKSICTEKPYTEWPLYIEWLANNSMQKTNIDTSSIYEKIKNNYDAQENSYVFFKSKIQSGRSILNALKAIQTNIEDSIVQLLKTPYDKTKDDLIQNSYVPLRKNVMDLIEKIENDNSNIPQSPQKSTGSENLNSSPEISKTKSELRTIWNGSQNIDLIVYSTNEEINDTPSSAYKEFKKSFVLFKNNYELYQHIPETASNILKDLKKLQNNIEEVITKSSDNQLCDDNIQNSLISLNEIVIQYIEDVEKSNIISKKISSVL